MNSYGHLTFEEMYKYINIQEATDENIDFCMEVGLHIDNCEKCLERLRILDGLKSTFDRWSAKTHGEMEQRLAFNHSLIKLADISEDIQIKNRIINWINKYSGKVASAVRLIMESTDGIKDDVTKIIPENIGEMLVSQPRWKFQYAGTSLRGAGTGIKIKTKIVDTEKSGTEIYINKRKRIVRIKLSCIPSREKVPLVVLVSKEANCKSILKLPEYDNNKYWVAEFEDVAPGEYIIAFEPIE